MITKLDQKAILTKEDQPYTEIYLKGDEAKNGDEEANKSLDAIEDPLRRETFFKKVQIVLSLQLIFTFTSLSIFTHFQKYRIVGEGNQISPNYFVIGNLSIIAVALSFFGDYVQKKSALVILLIDFTLAQTALTCVLTELLEPRAIFFAVILTVTLTVLSFFIRHLNIQENGEVFLLLVMLFVIIGVFVFIYPIRLLIALQFSAGVLIFLIHFIYDLQLLKGNHPESISTDDYIRAALNLYMDIGYVLLIILSFLVLDTQFCQ